VAGGRGKHMPIMITKAIDKSSPLLASALHECEEVECIINFSVLPLRAVKNDTIQFILPVRVSRISASKFPTLFA
jgi:type VI protein secretion system component Hcp